jgi:hypothetical protein
MHVQIVEFELQGMGHGEYEAFCDQLAPSFAQLPGLVAKVWIIDAEANRAGGVYTWVDRGACEAYLAGEQFAAARAEPTLANLRSRQFDVLERATDITRGLNVRAAA